MKKLKILSLLLIGIFISCKKSKENIIDQQVNNILLKAFKDKKTIPNPIVNLSNDFKDINSLLNYKKLSNRIVNETVWPDNLGKTILIESDNITVSDENRDIVYPGSILKSRPILSDYSFSPLSLRDYNALPIRVRLSISGEDFDGIIDEPNLISTKQFVESIVSKHGTVSHFKDLSYTYNQFSDYNELKYIFGANLNVTSIPWLAILGGDTKIKKKTGFVAKFIQEDFKVDMMLPTETELIGLKEINSLKDEYAPLYVSSVTYGKLAIFVAETDASFADFELAFKNSLNANATLTIEQRELLENAKIRYMISFPSESKADNGHVYERFKNSLVADASVSNDNFGRPISFRMRSLSDFSLFNTTFKIDLKY